MTPARRGAFFRKVRSATGAAAISDGIESDLVAAPPMQALRNAAESEQIPAASA